MFKTLEDIEPDYLAIAFDLKAPTHRHKLYDKYKATRKGMPDELASQMPILKDVLRAMNIKIVEKEGYEADDILGTLAKWGENQGLKVTVLTGDRDYFQLASKNITIQIPRTKMGKTETEDFDEDKIIELLKENNIDLIVLAGYLKIITPKFVDEFRNKIINIHPSLIPSFCGKGYYGEKVHQGVIDYGAKVTGATVHFVDEGADTGAIIMQETVNVEQDDDAKSLAKRVLEVEHRILKESIRLFCENKLSIQGRRVFINE